MKLHSKLLLLLSTLAVSGTALAMPVDQFKFFDMQRMITDGYQFPTYDRTAQPATQETSRKAERNDTHQSTASKTPDDKNPMPM
jgi:hypothetical protein